MGTSTDGLLWYGVSFDGSPDDGDVLAEKVSEILNGPDDGEDYLYGDGREWLAANGLVGVEFVTHCSYDYPMYGLAVAGTVTRAYRGSPELVAMDREPDAFSLVAALEALGVSVDTAPLGWHLASLWG